MIVIDASIAIKWIMKDEEDSDKALGLYQNHLLKRETILVPRLFFIEVANSLVTKTSSTIATIEADLHILYRMQLGISDPDENDLLITSKQAKKYQTTVYDMLYAVTAQKHNIMLVTADDRFIMKTKFPFVKLLSEFDSS